MRWVLDLVHLLDYAFRFGFSKSIFLTSGTWQRRNTSNKCKFDGKVIRNVQLTFAYLPRWRKTSVAYNALNLSQNMKILKAIKYSKSEFWFRNSTNEWVFEIILSIPEIIHANYRYPAKTKLGCIFCFLWYSSCGFDIVKDASLK